MVVCHKIRATVVAVHWAQQPWWSHPLKQHKQQWTFTYSTNKCTVLYIMYCTINLLLLVSVHLWSSGSLHHLCYNSSKIVLQWLCISDVQVLVKIYGI
jgi:hypothetical protein